MEEVSRQDDDGLRNMRQMDAKADEYTFEQLQTYMNIDERADKVANCYRFIAPHHSIIQKAREELRL